MDHFKESANPPPGLSAERLIGWVLTLEQGQARKTLASIQKGASLAVALGEASPEEERELRELKSRILEEMKMNREGIIKGLSNWRNSGI